MAWGTASKSSIGAQQEPNAVLGLAVLAAAAGAMFYWGYHMGQQVESDAKPATSPAVTIKVNLGQSRQILPVKLSAALVLLASAGTLLLQC